MIKKSPQFIYVQTPNIINLSERLDSRNLINLGKTTCDENKELKRKYPINSEKIVADAWILRFSFEIKNEFEKIINRDYKTQSKSMDQPFHDFLKASSSDWVWVDPEKYDEIKGSREIFRYIGEKPLEQALNDLKKTLGDFQNAVIHERKLLKYYFDDSDKNICSRKILERVAWISGLLSEKGIVSINNGNFIRTESEKENYIHEKSIWFHNINNCLKTVQFLINIANGNFYIYLKDTAYRDFYSKFDEKYAPPVVDKQLTHKIAYFKLFNILESEEEEVKEIIQETYDLIKTR